MIKMVVMKYVGGSYSLFDRCGTYIGRTTKKGHLYAFNEKGYWTSVARKDHAHNGLEKYFTIEKTFYVNNYKESLSYPLEVDSLNWGVDIEKILSGAKFTFKLHYTSTDILYTGQIFINKKGELELVTNWTSPINGMPQQSLYSSHPIRESVPELMTNVIKHGLWIIKSIEDN